MSSDSHFDNFLGRVRGLKEIRRGEWVALCPSHDDANPSLSIKRGLRDNVVFNCRAGCSQSAVLQAMGVKFRELFDPSTSLGSGGKRIVATYQYVDEAGVLLYEKLRYQPKDFGQRRPDGNGGWIASLEEARRVLYRLPALLASEKHDLVFVVNGEKAADRLAAAGLIATCGPSGEGIGPKKWMEEFNAAFAGRAVVLLADNDQTGRAFADHVARQLQGVARSVRIINLPALAPKADAFDWFEAGGTADKLLSIAQAAPVFNPENMVIEQPEPEQWPDPLPLPAGLPPVLPFDFDLLPDAVHPWIQDIAQRMQCPPDYCAGTLMVVAGALIGRKVAIRPKRHDDWQVVPNLYGANVGRPSLMKTPAMREMLKFLGRLEVDAKAEYAKVMAEHEAAALVADATKKLRKEELKRTLKAGGDAQAVADCMTTEAVGEPTRRRYLVNDTTVEKLGLILSENPNGVLLFVDELVSLLRTMEREGHEGDRGFYLTAWAGDSRYTYDRIGRGTLDIEAAIVSIIGSIQPGVLTDYLRGAVRGGGGDDGLIQRFQIAVWPDAPATWTNIDSFPDADAKAQAFVSLRRLADLSPQDVLAQIDGCDRDSVPFLRFDDQSQRDFDGWRQQLENRLRNGSEHPAIESHLAKYRSLIPSLALILHLMDGGVGPIAVSATRKAIAWGRYLESHARRLYASVTEAPAVAARLLAGRIHNGDVQGPFAARDVYRNGWSGLDRERTETAIDVLLSLNWLEERIEPTPGKNRTRYAVNPKIEISLEMPPTKPTEAPFVSIGSAQPEDVPDFGDAAWGDR